MGQEVIQRIFLRFLFGLCLLSWANSWAADKFTTIYSARVLAQALPWIAEEAGLFKKYNLDHNLVFIASSSIATAALLSGDPDMVMTGGVGNVIAFVRGSTDIVYIGSAKNSMTQNIIAGGNLKRPEDLKGKRIAVSRIGSNSHYFTIQALRRHNMEPNRDYTFLQSGGDPESLTALFAGGVEVACLAPPTDVQALARGFHYVIYGPDLKIPYAATSFVTKRATIARRPQAMAQYMRAMGEASKILHSDREFVYRVLGKQLRINDRTILDAAYNAEIKVMEPRLALKAEAFQAILDEVAQTDERAKKVKPQELTDTRFLNDMEKSGFWDQIWAKR
ncbi:MAG: ABC transporter substrate-binding protein [Deltaproteobacteria bacterium]|nr:ABC transporter substrate-binding protein [Deltaproteobacteria bacterium]